MSDTELNAWSYALDDFPLELGAREKLTALVRYAIRAPSSHNTQPWLFRISGETLDLFADRTRGLPVSDPHDRELMISCGAAIGCIEIALRHFGYSGAIRLMPDPAEPDLVARIELGSAILPSESEHAVFAALLDRRTCRLPFDPKPVDAALLEELESIADAQGAWFQVVQAEHSRLTLAELIEEGNRLQMADPSFRRELAVWLHPNRSRSHDGMPGYAHGFDTMSSLALPLVVRTFDTGTGKAAHDRELALGAPVLAVLGTQEDTPRGWILTGRVLIRLILRAQLDSVATSFLNQPIERSELRWKVSSLLGRSGFPQLILRMGHFYGRCRPTPRRAVEDVLIRDE